MSENVEAVVREICQAGARDRTRMMEIVRAVQAKLGCVCSSAIDLIAQELHVHRVEVESMVSFYAYLSRTPQGKVVIRLCNDVIDQMAGAEEVARAFSQLKAAGKVRHFGVCNFRPTLVTALQAVCPMPLVAHQVEISLAKLDAFTDGTLDQCLIERITPMAWSPLAAGLIGGGATRGAASPGDGGRPAGKGK
jgi:aryl-alcohol dehydrogenase-like predicted oxidoreductase